MQEFQIIGRSTHTPELKTTSTGKTYSHLSVAVSTGQKDDEGNYLSDFYQVTVWEKSAEYAAKWIAKGDLVMVKGLPRAHIIQPKDGSNPYAVVQISARQIQKLAKSQKTSGNEMSQEEAMDELEKRSQGSDNPLPSIDINDLDMKINMPF